MGSLARGSGPAVRSAVPNFPFIWTMCQRIFGPLSKNNTGMAVLRAGLPVIDSFGGSDPAFLKPQ